MKKRIFLSIIATSILAVIICSIFIAFLTYNYFYNQVQDNCRFESNHIYSYLTASDSDAKSYLSSLHSRNRLTLIAADGTVLFDNSGDIATMDNHANRPEIIDAIDHGYGESGRYSDTLNMQTFYYARLLDSGEILRVAASTNTVLALLVDMAFPYMLFVLAFIIIIALIMAQIITKRMIAPLNKFAADDFALADLYPELSHFILQINKQKKLIQSQLDDLSHSQDQFITIVENMGEGLILLDKDGEILFINSYAGGVLDINPDHDYRGCQILELNRSLPLSATVNQALAGQKNSCTITVNQREIYIAANPLGNNGQPAGLILLLADITEKQEAEQLRREFSANVSHELKTPLTSISGYAEIMKNGLVSSEDIIPFAAKIHQESNRLIQLIEDIINISRLDEGSSGLQMVEVDLAIIAEQALERCQGLAEQNQVKVASDLQSLKVQAVPTILAKIFDNLCENAIKYNRPGGSLHLSIKPLKGHAQIIFSDSGIGIPQASQKRVFERFYRVDKSHSKETGGTGLGLSIVKHGVEIHQGQIELDSSNQGTIIKILLPLN